MSLGHASLLVVDDFYSDWRSIRDEAVASSFKNVPNVSLSYLHASPNTELAASGARAIARLIGERYLDRFLESHFFLGTDQAAAANLGRGSWIHFDRCRWVGIVYLNPIEQCCGGTSFYRHHATGVCRWEQLRLLGASAISMVMADSARLDAWEEICRIGMVPNRLVLFDSRQFHQATCYFGEGPSDGRLTQHFYFDEVPDSMMNNLWVMG